MLEIQDLHVSVHGTPVLKGIDLKVEAGETFILFGPNGSGKTTLLMTLMGFSGYEVTRGKIIYDESTAPASLKYGAFITGDNAYSVINNPDVTDGSSCIVVKESFGNAFVPFLTDHYQTIYVLDYRYWKGSISQFAVDKGVQDVLFVNNLSAIRSTALVSDLHNVV